MKILRAFWLAVAAILALGGLAQAAPDLPPLTGRQILAITGLDPARFPGGEVDFDLGRLKALGAEHLHTSTIWTNGVLDFTGVPLVTLTHFLGLTSGKLHAVALNDYTVDIPVSDAVKDGPLLAYALGGKPMPVRDKGPLWIVYPYDQNPAYRNEVIYTRSIWQLEHIEVEH